MNREKLLKQAKKLCLNTDESILKSLEKESKRFDELFTHIKNIDVSGVKPMTRPVESSISYMREDTPIHESKKDIILKNSSMSNENFVVLKKVVKHD